RLVSDGSSDVCSSDLGGYLRGVADVTTANGYYLSQVQQARSLQTQADMSKLDLRRRMVEQQRYLKSLEPTPEEVRQKEIQDAIRSEERRVGKEVRARR